MADLAVLERRIEKVKGLAKAQPRMVEAELATLNELREHLQSGQLACTWEGSERAVSFLKPLALVTDKPRLYLANVGEEDLPDGGPLAAQVAERSAEEGAHCVVVCAQLEAELAEWDPEEAAQYRAEVGLTKSGVEALILSAYATLDLITFFTTTGGHEARAWPLPQGTPAVQAAGRIHTDMEWGFIRAEVLHFEELDRLGSMAAARERGLMRIEGRDYIVQDGDICHFRFNV